MRQSSSSVKIASIWWKCFDSASEGVWVMTASVYLFGAFLTVFTSPSSCFLFYNFTFILPGGSLRHRAKSSEFCCFSNYFFNWLLSFGGIVYQSLKYNGNLIKFGLNLWLVSADYWLGVLILIIKWSEALITVDRLIVG